MQRKGIGLLLAAGAAAAYGVYRYSKMTPEQKNDLKQKGKDLFSGKNKLFKRKNSQPATGY